MIIVGTYKGNIEIYDIMLTELKKKIYISNEFISKIIPTNKTNEYLVIAENFKSFRFIEVSD